MPAVEIYSHVEIWGCSFNDRTRLGEEHWQIESSIYPFNPFNYFNYTDGFPLDGQEKRRVLGRGSNLFNWARKDQSDLWENSEELHLSNSWTYSDQLWRLKVTAQDSDWHTPRWHHQHTNIWECVRRRWTLMRREVDLYHNASVTASGTAADTWSAEG